MAEQVALLRVRGIESTTPEFRAAFVRMARELGIDPNHIAPVIALESGFNPQARNPHGGATGLIQFMPVTARQLGTSTDELYRMTALEQLEFVEKFYEPWYRRLYTPGDVYMATFLPKYVGFPSETVLSVKGEKIYDANKGLDANGDGALTVGDVHARVNAEVRRAKAKPPIMVDPSLPESGGGWLLAGLAVAGAWSLARLAGWKW